MKKNETKRLNENQNVDQNQLNKNQLIVVTGGAGFIGSGVIRHLNDQGHSNILVIDDLECTDKWKNLVGKKFVDIINPVQLVEWLNGNESLVQAFIHLGACSDTLEMDADYLLENNYRFTIRLAEYAVRNNHRFIYASSAATYGDGSDGFSDDHKKLEKFSPLNMYGYSKHLVDLWAQNEDVLDHVVGLKYFNVFGPNEAHKGRMASAISKMVPLVQKEGVVKLFKSNDPDHFADGDQQRDFIYIKDAARMTCSFLYNDVGGIYNIGSGVATTWNQLAKAVFKALKKKPKIEYIDMPSDLNDKYQNYTCADMKKTISALKKESKCQSFDDSVDDYVKNYLVPGKKW